VGKLSSIETFETINTVRVSISGQKIACAQVCCLNVPSSREMLTGGRVIFELLDEHGLHGSCLRGPLAVVLIKLAVLTRTW
jgi:hypothetical protein